MVAGQQSRKKIAAIIQARMGSSRMPGKITMPLPFDSQVPLLSWPIKVLKKVPSISQIILATSRDEMNKPLADFSKKYAIDFIAGSEDDVIGRFADAIRLYNSDVVVRITGDNPILDSALIENVIQYHIESSSDYTYSVGAPIGMNVEVANADALLAIDEKPLSAEEREHVTLYFKNNAGFKVSKYFLSGGDDFSNSRLTVDYPADYATLNLVANISSQSGFEGLDLVRYINRSCPWIWDINNSLYQKRYYDSPFTEMTNAITLLDKHEMFFSREIIQSALDAESN